MKVYCFIVFCLVLLRYSCTKQASNIGALGLYANMGFMREDKLTRYYLNGGDAYRLKLCLDRVHSDESEIASQTELLADKINKTVLA